MSDGESPAPPIEVPTDIVISDDPRVRTARRDRLPWLGILAAALLHGLLVLWLLLGNPTPPPAEAPHVVPIQVVLAPPKPPPPPKPVPAAPKPPPPPQPKALSYRESGPGERTTAPAPAEKKAPEEAAPKPTAPAPPEKTETAEAPPPPPEKPAAPPQAPKPKLKPKRAETARLEPREKHAEKAQAPLLAPTRRLDIERGEKFETGDPYLNALHTLIEQHRVYPRVLGQFGLPVEGTAVIQVAVDRSGRILSIGVAQSSGAAGLDQAAEGMIRSAAPFPPLPANFPDPVAITIAIRLFPPQP